MNTNIELTLAEMAAPLYDGEEAKPAICPFCKGGENKDVSFCVKREGHTILYICHRASCGVRGRMSSRNQQAKQLRAKKRVFVTDPGPLSTDSRRLLKAKYYLTDKEILRGDIGETKAYSPGGKSRIYMPIYQLTGRTRGYSCKDLTKTQTPKALTFTFREDEPKASWYIKGRNYPLVIVEDQLSAIRLSSYVNSLALQGVDISDVVVDEIVRSSLAPKYLSLDRDATYNAVRLVIKHRPRTLLNVVPLPKDIKDMTRHELEEFISRNYKGG